MRTNSVFQGLGFTAFLAFAALTACSGSSTGTGTSTSSSSGGKGLFGGSTSSGGVSSGGASTSSGGQCSTTDSTDACDVCLAQSCCTVTLACQNNAQCVPLLQCASPCTDQTCISNCVEQNPNGQTDAQNVLTCAQNSCATPCDLSGSSSSSSSGSSGGSEPTGCLSAPPEGGTNCAAGKIPHDCPNGAPYTGCTPDPGGLSGIWCCSQ